MCGIAGHFELGRPGEGGAVVRAMCAALAHRGPDAEGVQSAGPMTLGHRRLSIIDLSAEGNQPLPNEDGSVLAVVNGEIYNFAEIRQRLIAGGHRFRSRSDSEVVAHLYEEAGDALVDQLRGMFAFAVWDARRQRLVLGRDRLGKKPLYWSLQPSGLSFASELPALLAGLARQGGRPEANLDAIDRYLTLQYVPAPLTAYKGVHKLPPGHVLTFERGAEPKLRRYWRLSFAPRPEIPSWKQAVAETRALLEEAVSIRMVADVPVGAFLSGGVDSSAVVALMARAAGGAQVKTFSIDFAGGAGEAAYARMVAQRYQTDHHEMRVEPDMVSIVPELVGRYGEPFADTSAVPVYYLSKMTRAHVKVVLSGDGGDETFAGYRRYLWHMLATRARRLPGPVWRAGAAVMSGLRSARHQPFRDFGRYLDRPPAERYLSFVAHFASLDKSALRGPALQAQRSAGAPDPVLQDFEQRMAAAGTDDDINQLLSLDTETYLADDILTKVDIASMAHALEVRAPLVDHVLMERMAGLPGRLKLRGWQGKRLLRAAVKDLVPPPILGRRKKGFSLPIDGWFRGQLRPMAHDLLSDRTARERGLVDPQAVRRLLAEQDAGASHGERLWNLVILELWCRQFLDRSH